MVSSFSCLMYICDYVQGMKHRRLEGFRHSLLWLKDRISREELDAADIKELLKWIAALTKWVEQRGQ